MRAWSGVVWLIAAGCGGGTDLFEASVTCAESCTVSWDGDPVGSVSVSRDDMGVWGIDRMLDGSDQNPVTSPHVLGSIPGGMELDDPSAPTLELEAGATYALELIRYSADGGSAEGVSRTDFTF